MDKKPVIALVGRPNVGKSTLFNRLSRGVKAIVDDLPGVTRDRLYADVLWEDQEFTLIDTGGFLPPEEQEVILPQVVAQCERAIEEADVIILLTDARTGPTPVDEELVRKLRAISKPFLIAVNKIDSQNQEKLLYDFYNLGVEKLWPISAIHGHGVYELISEALRLVPKTKPATFSPSLPEDTIKVALVGRPNVGKSSLFNQIVGDDRSVVSEIPGTTRDTINTLIERQGSHYLFMDTAGLRRKSRIKGRLERYSASRSLKAIKEADIALILLDAQEGLTDQDLRIIAYALEQGKGIIIGVNKWDLMPQKPGYESEYLEALRSRLRFAPYLPIFTLSALTGQGLKQIFPLIGRIYQEYTTRISTGKLNRFLEEIYARYQPPLYKNRPVKFYYMTQVAIKPPTFVIFTNYPQGIAENYKRYLFKNLQQLGFKHISLKILFRERRRKS